MSVLCGRLEEKCKGGHEQAGRHCDICGEWILFDPSWEAWWRHSNEHRSGQKEMF